MQLLLIFCSLYSLSSVMMMVSNVVLADTEGSFMVERALEMAHGMLADMRYAAVVNGKPEIETRLSEVTPDDILARIFYFRVFEYTEQIALMYTLEDFLANHSEVSAAFHSQSIYFITISQASVSETAGNYI